MEIQAYVKVWRRQGVSIEVPPQESGVRVRGVRRKLPPLQEMPGSPEFTPRRLVINFEVLARKGGAGLAEFRPAFTLRVRYTEADLEHARASGRPLTLAFWDGFRWNRFTREKHGFELLPNAEPGTGGFGYAHIAHWGDPAIGWGP